MNTQLFSEGSLDTTYDVKNIKLYNCNENIKKQTLAKFRLLPVSTLGVKFHQI